MKRLSVIFYTPFKTQQQPPQQTQQQNNFTEEILNINDTPLISDEQWQKLTNNPQVMVADNQQGMSDDIFKSLQVSTQPQTQHYRILCIHHPTTTCTVTNPTPSVTSKTTNATPSTATTTQQDSNRDSYRAPQSYLNSLSYPDNRRRKIHLHTHHKDRKNTKKER